ncbi:YhfG family protein [Mixta sp. Marseille-Q2659]|uniref:YhfG family protein n=1 Tax=Mixta sp. Marseille-Q2659 TaxID=2736607 RepID=UPI0023B981B1|nr:YhfG family protein [Mixta sp. Marseille-Q2659]
MPTKLTEKQKATLWQQRRNANFQASSKLEGLSFAEVTLNTEQATQRLAELRRQYGG